MMDRTKISVCSEIRTKHLTQSEHHEEFFYCKTWWYVKKPLGFKRLNLYRKRVEMLTITDNIHKAVIILATQRKKMGMISSLLSSILYLFV
jgi:hypothetical protein